MCIYILLKIKIFGKTQRITPVTLVSFFEKLTRRNIDIVFLRDAKIKKKYH